MSTEQVDTAGPVNTLPRWSGWARRPRGRWTCLVHSAATDTLALARLRALTASDPHVDLYVCLADKAPGDR